MYKILITGASGFIGKNLKEQLLYDIYAPTHQELDLLEADKVNKYLHKNKFDVIIHSAVMGSVDWRTAQFGKENFLMFANLVNNYKTFGKMIYFGSGAEYDSKHWVPKMPETYFGQHEPKDEYGLSKARMTKITETVLNIYNLRLFGVFGKYEDPRRFITTVIMNSLNNRVSTVNQNCYYDYIYIDDLVKVVDYFINNSPQEKIFNVCSSIAPSLEYLARLIPNANIRVKQHPMLEYSGDNTKLYYEMKEKPFRKVEDGIKEFYAYLKEQYAYKRQDIIPS